MVTFVYYHFLGFREHGLKYLMQFVGPIWYLFFLMIPNKSYVRLITPIFLKRSVRT